MPRWFEILLTLVLFSVGMVVLSWAVNATVPGGVDWLADRIGDGAVLAIMGVFFAAAGYLAWKGHRPAKGSAGRVDGR